MFLSLVTSRPDSRRPNDETARDNFLLFSLVVCGTGVLRCSEELNVAVFLYFADRLRVNERGPPERKNPGDPVCAPLCELDGVDNALRASVSKTDSQFRGSRDRPKILSLSIDPLGVPRTTALLLLRSPVNRGVRVGNIEIRFLDGDGSPSARITAFPSEDMAIRSAFRPLGGDGVNSPSFLTIASPSNDKDMRRDGGDLMPCTPHGVKGCCASDLPCLRSVIDRFLFAEFWCGVSDGTLACSLFKSNSDREFSCVPSLFSGASDVATLVWELKTGCSGSSWLPRTISDVKESFSKACAAALLSLLGSSYCSAPLEEPGSAGTLSSLKLCFDASDRGASSS